MRKLEQVLDAQLTANSERGKLTRQKLTRYRHWSRGCAATEKGPAELGRGGLHKGNTLAESCEDAGDRRFVQEKMNKVNNEGLRLEEKET